MATLVTTRETVAETSIASCEIELPAVVPVDSVPTKEKPKIDNASTNPAVTQICTAVGEEECTEHDSSPATTTSPGSSLNYQTPICCDMLFWIRLSILFLSAFLLALSISYCLAQLVETKLDIVNRCPEPKTREEIWEHSYQTALRKGNGVEVVMDEETMFGFTDDACWTTRAIEINTEQLWTRNKYDYQKLTTLNAPHALFGLLTIYWSVIILYGIVMLIMDLVCIWKGTLHTKSPLYRVHIREQRNKATAHHTEDEHGKSTRNGPIKRLFKWYMKIYFKYFIQDTSGWCITKFVGEMSEFMVQTTALLQYNGYNIFDPNNTDDVHLAERPEAVLTFAIILSFNLFGSGVLWSLYTLFPSKIYGLGFKRLIFFVDKTSDLLYSLYPIYLMLSDPFNENTENIIVLLGQLSIDSWPKLIAAFLPLFVLSNNCLMITITTMVRMRNSYFKGWKLRKALCESDSHRISAILERAKSAGYTLRRCELEERKGTLFDDEGNLLVDISQLPKEYDKNWINKAESKTVQMFRRAILSAVTSIYMVSAVFILLLTFLHINSVESHCSSVQESTFVVNGTFDNLTVSLSQRNLLKENPELLVWNNCLYKVYPFTKDDDCRCQCRVFVIDWDEDLESTANERVAYFNLTQPMIMNRVLSHWSMLEKLKTIGVGGSSTDEHSFDPSLKLPHLKAFEWQDALISSTGNNTEHPLIQWPNLEYLLISATDTMDQIPVDLSSTPYLKYLSLGHNNVNEIPTALCELDELVVFDLELVPIKSIPSCIGNMNALEAIWLDMCLYLADIPLSMFNLPNLLELSVFNGNVSYESLIQYNVPKDVQSDTDAVNQWFDENFKYDFDRTDYWFSVQPINEEDWDNFPDSLKNFLIMTNSSNDTLPNCQTEMSQFCAPRRRGFVTSYIDDVTNFCQPITAFTVMENVTRSATMTTICVRMITVIGMYCIFWAPGYALTTTIYVLSVLSFVWFQTLKAPTVHSNCWSMKNVTMAVGISLVLLLQNIYCGFYDVGSTFIAPTSSVAAVDSLQCPWNFTVNEINAENCSLSRSIHLDPNINTSLPEYSTYGQCSLEWIGDGDCDDPCRTNECINDYNDCVGEGNICGNTAVVWSHLAGDASLVAHGDACNVWEVGLMLFEPEDADALNRSMVYRNDCNYTVEIVDFNSDGYVNYREFVVIAGVVTGGEWEKYLSVNCSGSVDDYNPSYQG